MGVNIQFVCDGCEKDTPGERSLRRKFQGITGKSYGFGSYLYETPEDVKPDGWVSFDPYTGCCYCPSCWENIMENSNE
jgi:hypothetical protein